MKFNCATKPCSFMGKNIALMIAEVALKLPLKLAQLEVDITATPCLNIKKFEGGVSNVVDMIYSLLVKIELTDLLKNGVHAPVPLLWHLCYKGATKLVLNGMYNFKLS
jgi:hypothetical protein